MINLGGIAVGGAIGAGLLMPLVALRWAPQMAGRRFGPKARLVALIGGLAVLMLTLASFWSAHQSICAEADQENRCEISSVVIAAVLGWCALVALTQIRFAWSAVSAVWPKSLREA